MAFVYQLDLGECPLGEATVRMLFMRQETGGWPTPQKTVAADDLPYPHLLNVVRASGVQILDPLHRGDPLHSSFSAYNISSQENI